ncbi:MAG: DegT/DnrJ/EryC1/StrS family aminotransferase, partial [Wenzhouxiangellaceae bacterium]|nr:DegT/DnrJ/EryC1/StrS family aminotransferase [Wenzhouxiangellaceae bacterium]
LSPRTRAVLVVHLFGRPAPMDALLARTRPHGIAVVEDACEAVGATVRGRPVGGIGDAGTFGFYPNKPIAAGEGGMITADEEGFLTRCRQLRNQGLDPETGTRHPDRPGLSARLSELQAAVGRVQVERLEASLADRERVASGYIHALAGIEGLELPARADDGDRISWFTFPVRVRDPADRDPLREHLARQGIETGVYFEPVHRLRPYSGKPARQPLGVTEDLGRRCLALPLHADLAEEDRQRVVAGIEEYFGPGAG